MLFPDRREAGRVLASKLIRYAHQPDVVVLGLARGGVPVAFEVAKALEAPLDVFVVRKLGVPRHEELAMGAMASGNIRVFNDEVINALAIPKNVIDSVAAVEEREIERRERRYRNNRLLVRVEGKTVVLVDDGLATGSTMRAALLALRCLNPTGLVVAVPVAAASTCEKFKAEVDEVVCAAITEELFAVGECYGDFSQTTDDEVQELLTRAARSEIGDFRLERV